jgi:hypothetical protein
MNPNLQAQPVIVVDRGTFVLAMLGIAALILAVAHLITPAPALAIDSASNRDISVVTAESVAGGDALYVLNNRTSILAVVTFDERGTGLVVRDARSVIDLAGAN